MPGYSLGSQTEHELSRPEPEHCPIGVVAHPVVRPLCVQSCNKAFNGKNALRNFELHAIFWLLYQAHPALRLPAALADPEVTTRTDTQIRCILTRREGALTLTLGSGGCCEEVPGP